MPVFKEEEGEATVTNAHPSSVLFEDLAEPMEDMPLEEKTDFSILIPGIF